MLGVALVLVCGASAQATTGSADAGTMLTGFSVQPLAVTAPEITNPGKQLSTVDTTVDLPIAASHLTSLTAAPLPAGLALTEPAAGEFAITGEPMTPGTTTVTLEATNEEGGETSTSTQSFEWTIDAATSIDQPGSQSGTVGVEVSLPITGAELHLLTPEHLPEGIEPQKVSETEWVLAGTPGKAETATVKLEATNSAGGGATSVEFTWTIAPQPEGPVTSQPPTATGTLTVSPGVVFSAAKAVCGGLTWSTTTVATQWLLDGAPITGAAAATFTAPRADDGHQLSCRQTASAGGLSASLTSAARTIHEQPAEPAWPISPATEQCATAVCMQEGSAPAATGESYPQSGAWWATRQVRCVSAPWTSAVGDSALPGVRAFAEAHTATLSLQRVTAAGAVTVATQQLGDLTTARDGLDGAGSPFAGAIVSSFGAQAFAAHELWTGRYPGATGHPDWFAPGGGLIAYAPSTRSFQLTYSLSTADLGSRLRCLAGAEDGPAAASTVSSFTSPEYAVAASARCGPSRLAPRHAPQPAVVEIGDPRCLPAASSLPAIGAGLQGIAVKGSALAVSLSCGLAGGCDGTLTLSSSRPLATASLRLTRGHSRLLRLHLSSAGRSELRAAGSGGLAATMRLSVHGHTRPLVSLRLLSTR
jgi:hypothetical protein